MFYVYLLRRPDKEDPFEPGRPCPFYVGKGSNGRVKGHRKEALSLFRKPGRKSLKINVIHKLWAAGLNYEKEIIWAGGSERQAFFFECQVITDYGRVNNKTGCLTNLTDGGDGPSGTVISEETRQKLRNKVITAETRKKWSEARKGNKNRLGIPHTEEAKKKMREIGASEDHKKKLSAAHKGNIPWNKGLKGVQAGEKHGMFGRKHSEESIRKMSEGRKGQIPWNKGKKIYEKKEDHPWWGKHHSEESKEKMRKAKRNYALWNCKQKTEILINTDT